MPTPRFSLSAATAMKYSFQETLELCRNVGADGIGFHEDELEDYDADLAEFRRSGLKATTCAPATFSILPLGKWPGPEDPGVRIEQISAGIRRLAPFEPNSCTVLTGPQGRYETAEAREIIVDGLRRVARNAAEVGVIVALEPFHRNFMSDWTIVSTLPEMDDLLNEVNEPNTAMLFDVWHLWDTPDVLAEIRRYAHRFSGVHVDDWREPTRSWCDRVLPGDGLADLLGIFGALDDGGFNGYLDLEIVSDDGTYDTDYPDSLWKMDPLELIRRGKTQTLRAWEQRHLRAG